MVQQPYLTLNNGVQMPLLGLGVYEIAGKEVERTVSQALDIGYRLLDTASMYMNEKEVGNAVRSSGLNRQTMFITTKVNNPDQGYDATLVAFDESMKRLAIDYIDLYLIHWPVKDKRKDTWKALERLYENKQVRAIGVSNYLVPFLQELDQYARVTPAVNQIEFSPYLFLKDVLEYCKSHHIQLQSYSPLTRGLKLMDPRLIALSTKYEKTVAQLILRWNIQQGIATIPKSSNYERLKENFEIFDFSISEEDILFMNSFHENFRVVDDPIQML